MKEYFQCREINLLYQVAQKVRATHAQKYPKTTVSIYIDCIHFD